MLPPSVAAYIGNEQADGFTGFISEGNWFGVLKTSAGLSKEDAIEFLKKLSYESEQDAIVSLDAFESYLTQKWKKADLPAHFSCAIGYRNKDKFFLKTTGAGEVYLRRSESFAKLIEGDSVASGFIEAGDFVIFTTNDFSRLLDEEQTLKDFVREGKPQSVVEEITPYLKKKEDTGVIALFISFGKEVEEPYPATREDSAPARQTIFDTYLKKTRDIVTQFKEQFQRGDKKKNTTLILIIVVLVVFLWSVILGYQRRAGAKNRNNIETTRELIEEKLNQAEDVAFLNLPRAIALITDAKNDLSELKKNIKDDKNKDVVQLASLIADREKSILKTEEKKAEEYFDLSVENESAKGSKLYLAESTLVVLDKRGEIYLLSLLEKSLEKKAAVEIKSATLVALDKDIVYFYKDSGVFQIAPDKKAQNVIKRDKDWGDIRDLTIFNGNLYLLDAGKSTIYKHLVTEKGFSDKASYFKSGEKPNIKAMSSFAIDGSVYIAAGDILFKYIEGVRDDFDTVFPEEGVSINKIVTNADLEKVYAWDKRKGALYIVAKTGTYERQIKAPILKKASDVVVFKNDAYILSDELIYKINLD